MRKFCLFLCLSLVLSILLIGCAEESTPKPFPPPPIPSQEFIEISASQLYQEYDNNEVAAKLKYKAKMLKVTGIIQNIGEDILGDPYVVIVGDEDDWWGVQCTYPDTPGYRDLLAKFNTGETVTVTGRCKGYLLHVQLEHE